MERGQCRRHFEYPAERGFVPFDLNVRRCGSQREDRHLHSAHPASMENGRCRRHDRVGRGVVSLDGSLRRGRVQTVTY